MMRIALTIAAIVLASSMVAAQDKSICTPIQVQPNSATGKSAVINPALIQSPSVLRNMSNRGQGSYNMVINLCAPGYAARGCAAKSYVSAANETGCAAEFTTVIQRPTLLPSGEGVGFKVTYGQANADSTGRNVVEIVVTCNAPSASSGVLSQGLVSRSGKFWSRPNKWGGMTYMVVTSTSACFVRPNVTSKPPVTWGPNPPPTKASIEPTWGPVPPRTVPPLTKASIEPTWGPVPPRTVPPLTKASIEPTWGPVPPRTVSPQSSGEPTAAPNGIWTKPTAQPTFPPAPETKPAQSPAPHNH